MNSGIYCIYNIIKREFYIGSSKNIIKRFREHKQELYNKKHHSKYLQNSWNKYGKSNFIFKVIRLCNPEDCIQLEQYFINAIQPEYNMCKIAGSCLGIKRTPEIKEAIRLRQLGRVASIATKVKMSIAHKGKILSPEHKYKVQRTNLGKKLSEETKRKMSIAQFGKALSLDTRLKISESQYKPVIQICPQTKEVLREYLSLTEASKLTNVNLNSISKVALGKQNLAGGFNWKYKNNNHGN